MIVLGIDPGYANLGLSVFDTETNKVLEGVCVRAGDVNRPHRFAQRVVPLLEAMHGRNKVEAVALEGFPIFPRNAKGTAGIWAATSTVLGWAACYDMEIKMQRPIALKQHCAKVLGKPWNRNFMATKAEMGEAVAKITGKAPHKIDHVNDATMAAHACYGG